MSTTDSFSDTKDVAKDHAQQAAQAVQARTGEVAGHAKEATHDVAATAAEQVGNVKQETVRQTRNLLSEASSQLSTQAGEQTQRLTQLLRELADELKQMASAGNGGQASELAHQASERAHQAAAYLEGRQPGDLVEDVRSYARRRPGAFLAGAALLGLAAGRVGRGVKAANDAAPQTPPPVAPPTNYNYLPPPPEAIDLSGDQNMGLSSSSGPAEVNDALTGTIDEPLYASHNAGYQTGYQP